ncbi:MAG: F0F1 ATP synthase subunit delta [Gammaproteobacteria bacterium]|nr:F0F1 ATP synthase subunit delta [Gammaproteobacteria bacterium]
MAELTTLARPYARAAFELAARDNALGQWSQMLSVAAAVSTQAAVRSLLINPALSAEQVATAFLKVCGEAVDSKIQNLVRLLAENRRLQLLPAVSELFEQFKAAREQSVDVEITTAYQISPEITAILTEALKTRLSREIRLATQVDEGLIGGAIIRAGDTVIDSSVRGKLNKLAESLSA